MSDNTCSYTQLSQVDHVLTRPSMYIGSIHNKQQSEYVVSGGFDQSATQLKIVKKEMSINEGLIKIFSEILSNASDNWVRSVKTQHPVTKIEINVNKFTGETSVANNGLGIRFDVDKNTGLRVPEMIFGNLLTSSNYTNDETRAGAGVYGIGAKATNIFSKLFQVSIRSTTQQYVQSWSNNMKICNEPCISRLAQSGTNWVKVQWTPDFDRFEINGYSDDHIWLMYKMAIDIAMITGVTVIFNQHEIVVSTFEQYVKLYCNQEPQHIVSLNDAKSSVVLLPSSEFEAITFVNGLLLKQGVHVKVWTEAFLRPVMEAINSSSKTADSKSLLAFKEVQSKFRIFLKHEIKNPEFANASKTSLIGPIPQTPTVAKSLIKTILSWPNIFELKQLLMFKASAGIRKLEKDVKHVHVDGYEAANLSRTKRSAECSLLICEGLSAKTFCVEGLNRASCMGNSGRDFFGILPQKGKGLNVLNAPAKQIQDNAEIKNLIQVLGLKLNVDYTKAENRKTLHYGKVILMTDSDCDGSHISGLIITFFNTMYPSLIQAQDFVYKMATPIITIKQQSNRTYKFYNLFEARKYIQAYNPPAKSITYLKGLGSSSDNLIKEIFGKRMIRFVVDDQTQDLLIKAFHKDYPDIRKQWLQDYKLQDSVIEQNSTFPPAELSDPESLEYLTENSSISDFIKRDLVEFSIVDCKRSIPSVFDGLKESQRKIVFTCFQKNLSFSSVGLKTSQLAGAVAELTNFKYGEESLHDTIYRLGHNFVGSNNVNILDPTLSQFGSRLTNGNDAPAARYTKTRLSKLSSYVFRKEDEELLAYIEDEGQKVEPEYYMPIIPMILVNGCNGIGVGFSSKVPNFNPLELVEMIKTKLLGKTIDCKSVTPWYRGFKGGIKSISDFKFEITGAITKINDDKYKVIEIPVTKSLTKFKEQLQTLVETGEIRKLLNHCTTDHIDYTLVGQKNGFIPTLKNLKLIDTLHLSNMVLFGKHDNLAKYTFEEIFDTYFAERLSFYVRRIELERNRIQTEILLTKQRYEFILAVIDGKITVYRKGKQAILDDIKNCQFKDIKNNNFANLLNIPLIAFTEDELTKLALQISSLQTRLEQHLRIQPAQVWCSELDEFVLEFRKEIKNTTNKTN